MKKLLALMLAAALALSLAACGGGDGETPSVSSSAPGENSQALQTPEKEHVPSGGSSAPEENDQAPEKEHVIPGTYEAVSLVSADAYVLNENGSFDSGEQKGTYTADDDGSRISFQFKDNSSSSTLIACGEYYHTEAKMTEDTEYGLAPSFDDTGRSNQTFTTQADDVSLTLELHEDGSFIFSTDKASPVLDKFRDVITYEGSYTLEDTVLNLNWNGVIYPFLFADEVIYPVVYTKQTDANSGEIETAQNAVQTAEEEAAQNRWWTPADEVKTAEVLAALAGTWEYGDQFSVHQLEFTDSEVWVHTELFGQSFNDYGDVIVLNGALKLDYETRMGGYNVIAHQAAPYTYAEDGSLVLYEMLDMMNEEAILDPEVDFTSVAEEQYQKMS